MEGPSISSLFYDILGEAILVLVQRCKARYTVAGIPRDQFSS